MFSRVFPRICKHPSTTAARLVDVERRGRLTSFHPASGGFKVVSEKAFQGTSLIYPPTLGGGAVPELVRIFMDLEGKPQALVEPTEQLELRKKHRLPDRKRSA